MPRQIGELDADALARKGLAIAPSELWDPAGGGLLDAVVNLGGCSAGFVSADGLIATNHHCAYAAIQAASSVEHDYLKEGFLAATRDAEITAKDEDVEIVQRITDVTAEVREVVEREHDPAARARRGRAARQGARARLRGGRARATLPLRRVLLGRRVPADRLAGAPRRPTRLRPAIGDRQLRRRGRQLDVAAAHRRLRAACARTSAPRASPPSTTSANVPYRPKRFLPVASEGVEPGDFVAVLGFPGKTQRYQSSAEVARQIDQVLPARAELYGEWIDLLEAAGAHDDAVRIKVAAKLRSMQNREKNARGMLAGLAKNGTLARREREDAELVRWAATQNDPRYATTLERIGELAAARREGFAHDFVLEGAQRGANALAIAVDIVRRARERGKPDLERAKEYMDRDADRLWSMQQRRIRDFDRDVDRALLASWLRRVAALPDDQRFASVSEADAERLLRTRVVDPAFAERLWQADWATIERERDPLIAFGRALVPELEALEQRERALQGTMLELGPRWFEMLDAVRTGPVYPDANGTLRVSFATVAGYAPRDGLVATPQTTVAGLVAKHTGADPFDVPQAIREAAPQAGATYWADPALGDVPVAMLSDADTTGGNSGSPVIDGRGRWVGLNFDRVWENIAGDFGYDPERSRNIIVDVRYLLWLLDEVVHAQGLLDELGVAELAKAPARANAGKPDASVRAASPGAPDLGLPLEQPSELAPAEVGCGCAAQGGRQGAWPLCLLLLLGIARARQPCADACTTASAE